MNKKDILELKRRYTKEDCTFTRVCGCYVDGEKNKIVEFGETFLNLEEEEFFKYLEIAKKALSGTIGNNILELDYPTEEEAPGGKQQFFMALKDSKLKNDALMERFYELIIENYQCVGNYLILLFHDVYDVVTKTNDNLKLDESEEVYEYLLCAICPVNLSKPGLGYRADENRIGARIRDWVVGAPDFGFLFPAFSDRSSDIHKLGYYVRDPKDSYAEFVETALGCSSKRTATEEKLTFHNIVKRVLEPVYDKSDEMLLDIQETLSEKIVQEEEIPDDDLEEVVLAPDEITEVLTDCGIPETAVSEIKNYYEEVFGATPPVVKNLIDEKAVEANVKVKKERELVKQVAELQKELVEQALHNDDEESSSTVKTYDVVLRVKPEKAEQIKSQVIGDQKYLIIPMSEGEYVNLNGINTQV